MINETATTFACVGLGLLIAHQVADHWVQTGYQAAHKGLPGWPGRIACATHVATYTATTAAVVALLWATLGLDISPLGFVTGQLVSALTHYWADRRFTLATLCERLGKGEFYRLGAPRSLSSWTRNETGVDLYEAGKGDPVPWDNPSLGTGAYALDQSWHWLWLGVSAFVTAMM